MTTDGAYVQILQPCHSAPRGGASTELPVDILSLYRRQISLVGCNTAAQSQSHTASILAELTRELESGALKAPEEKSLGLVTLDQAIDAYSGKVKKAVVVFD